MNRRRAILTLAVILALGLPAALLGPGAVAARERRATKSYPVHVVCTDQADGWCLPRATQTVRTTKLLMAEFVANPGHCTPIEVLISSSVGPGLSPIYQRILAPGESTGGLAFGPAHGSGEIGINARDAPGGPCADGPLSAWEGTLTVTTSKRVRR